MKGLAVSAAWPSKVALLSYRHRSRSFGSYGVAPHADQADAKFGHDCWRCRQRASRMKFVAGGVRLLRQGRMDDNKR